jgi:anti-sigma-K factor RskA
MTDRTPPRDDDNLLAAEYALGVLQGPARDAFARRMADDPNLAAAVRTWDEDFSSLAAGIAPVAPASGLQQQLEARLFGQTQKPSWWNSLGLWRGVAMASLAAVVALGAWNMRPIPVAEDEALVAQLAGEANAIKLLAFYDDGQNELRINRTEGTAAAGRSFELWLIAGTDAPVSLGVLPAGQIVRIAVPEKLRSKFKGGVLAISDEPAGGSPTGAPTGAVLATGQLSAV